MTERILLGEYIAVLVLQLCIVLCAAFDKPSEMLKGISKLLCFYDFQLACAPPITTSARNIHDLFFLKGILWSLKYLST